MKKRAVWFLFAGFVILILAFVLRGQTSLSLFFYTALLNMGFIAIAYSVYLSNLPRDERTKRLGAKSLAWSWMTTFIMLGILMQVDNRWPDYLTVQRVLLILYFTMLMSTAIFYRWLYHRGGTE